MQKLNPFTKIFAVISVIGYIPTLFTSIGKTFNILYLQLRLKWWYDAFPGIHEIPTSIGRAWVMKGFEIAADVAKLTETTIDDEIVQRGLKVVKSDAGWQSIVNIMNLAIESVDEIDNKTATYATSGKNDHLVCAASDTLESEACSLLGNQEDTSPEDPITILYIVLIAIKIATAIREHREKRKTEILRIRQHFRNIEINFVNRVVNLRRKSNA